MARINKSQYAILGMLSKEAMSGYDIKCRVNNDLVYWSESNAQIYPILKRLQEQDMIAEQPSSNNGKRKRCVYRITTTGVEYLRHWLAKPVAVSQYREEMLLKLNLANYLSKEQLIDQVAHYRSEVELQKKCFAEITNMTDEIKDTLGEDFSYIKFSQRFVELDIDAKLRWCEETLAEIN